MGDPTGSGARRVEAELRWWNTYNAVLGGIVASGTWTHGPLAALRHAVELTSEAHGFVATTYTGPRPEGEERAQ